MSINLASTIFTATWVILLYLTMYYFIPSRVIIFNQEETWLDRFFQSLVHSNLLVIYIVHGLVLMRLYEILSLMMMGVLVCLIVLSIRGKMLKSIADTLGLSLIIKLMDFSEGKLGLKEELLGRLRKWFLPKRGAALESAGSILGDPFAGILIILAFAAAAGIRFYHSLVHSYYGASDPYVHLAWIKYLGANEFYRSGIHSGGYHAVLSAMSVLFNIDPYYVVRFMGPAAGVLIVLSVWFFAGKGLKSNYAALLAVLLYGVVLNAWPNFMMWRQTTALPQEYAAIFLLPGCLFLIKYLERGLLKHLLLAAECLALTILISPYVTVFLVLGYMIVFLCHAGSIRPGILGKSVLALMAAALLGSLPVLAGFFAGNSFHVQEGLAAAPEYSQLQPYVGIALVSALAVMVQGFFSLAGRENINGRIYLFVSFFTILLFLFIQVKRYNLAFPVDPNRLVAFMALIGVIACAALLASFERLKNNQRLKDYRGVVNLQRLVILAAIAYLVMTPFQFPDVIRNEYDEAANAYIQIKKDFPYKNWTLIAPVEQYQQALGYGFHYEILSFVKEISEPGKSGALAIPTDYIFFFVEKIPIGLDREISKEEALAPIPDHQGDLNMFYYGTPENRAILEAKLYVWAEEFMKRNSSMKVYFENENMKIYMLKQDGKYPLNLLAG